MTTTLSDLAREAAQDTDCDRSSIAVNVYMIDSGGISFEAVQEAPTWPYPTTQCEVIALSPDDLGLELSDDDLAWLDGDTEAPDSLCASDIAAMLRSHLDGLFGLTEDEVLEEWGGAYVIEKSASQGWTKYHLVVGETGDDLDLVEVPSRLNPGLTVDDLAAGAPDQTVDADRCNGHQGSDGQSMELVGSPW